MKRTKLAKTQGAGLSDAVVKELKRQGWDWVDLGDRHRWVKFSANGACTDVEGNTRWKNDLALAEYVTKPGV